jgi:flagellar hook-length control protein FliK
MNVLAALAPPPQAPEASGAAPPGAPPAPPGGPPFHSALAEHWARTANAEGQQSEGSRPAGQPGVQPKQAQRQEEGQSTAAGQRPLDEQAGPGSTPRTHERARRDAGPAHHGGTDASASPSADGAGSAAGVSSAASSSSSSATGSSSSSSTTTADPTGQGADEGAPLLTATAGASTIAAASTARAGATAENSAEAAPGAEAKDPAHGVAVASRAGAQATADSQTGAVVAKPDATASADAPSSSVAPASTGAASTSQASALSPASAGPQTGSQSQTTVASQATAGSTAHTAPLASKREAAAGSTVSGAASEAAHTPAQARPSVASADTGALAGGIDTGTSRSAQAHGQAGTPGQPAGGAGSPVSPGGASTEQGAHDGAHGRDHAGAPPSTSADPAASAFDANGASAAAGDPLAELLAPAEAADASAGFAASLPGGPVVDMQQVIESARATIELAARQGATLAKIALQPGELGEIRIHLSQSADGLIARVTADTAAAAQALAEGRAELHQSLSSLGVSLLRLDIGSGQPQPQDREGRSAGGAGGSSASGASGGREEDDAADALGQPAGAGEATTTTTGLDSGGLVDVLA